MSDPVTLSGHLLSVEVEMHNPLISPNIRGPIEYTMTLKVAVDPACLTDPAVAQDLRYRLAAGVRIDIIL